MPLTIPDELLKTAGLTEGDARLEFACLLFDSGKLSLPAAAKWAKLSRPQFEEELFARKIPLFRPAANDLDREVEVLKQAG